MLEKIKGLYLLKYPQSRMAKELGISITSVRRYMRKLGLKGYSNGVKVSVNDGYFKIINDEHKAYWLGYLVADGCIGKSAGTRRSIHFFLARKDEGAVQGFADDIGYRGKIYRSEKRMNSGIMFNSMVMAGDLIKLGYLDWKSGNPRLLDNIPADLMRHFIRGFFDGDGSVVVSKRRNRNSRSIGITIVAHLGHTAILERVEDIVASNTGVSRSGVKLRSTCCAIRWLGNKQARSIHDWMYHEATIFLNRKKDRFRFFDGYYFRDIQDFRFSIGTNDIGGDVIDSLISEFSDLVVRSGWVDPKYDIEDAYLRLSKVCSYVKDGKIYNKYPYGNKIILSFSPKIWRVSRGNPAIFDISSYPNSVRRAVRNFFSLPDKRLYSERLVRELLFAGFSRASLLSTPVIMSVIKKFGLDGRWFDPCAGWGNRLLAAHLLNIDYCGTDPNTYCSLVELGKWLDGKKHFVYSLYDKKWQDLVWPDFNFVFTSPPFHSKEDYLDGADYGVFDEWCRSFIFGLVDRAIGLGRRVVLHVDKLICDFICREYCCDVVELVPLNQHKLGVEFFVEVISKK